MKASAPRSSRQPLDVDQLQAGSAILMTGPSMLGPLARAAAVALVFAAPTPAAAQQVTTTTYGYDARGNLTTITDPRGKVTTQTFDVLDRMTRQLQPPSSTGGTRPSIGVGYDGLDQVRSVTDPRNLATTYAVDGLGNATGQTSPDTGITNRTFDASGNLATETDARGKTTTFSYDALNRLTRAAYPTGTATVLEWDGGATPTANARGRLTRITDESGSTAYTYDGFGQVLTKTQTTGALVRTVRYAYGTTGTATGKLASITYPSGNRVNLAYDTAGRISGLTLNPTNANGVGTNTAATVTLLSGIAYQPFGAPRAWTWGNGAAYSRTFDLDGRLVTYPLGHAAQGGVVRTVAWDAASRVTGYTHVNGAGAAQPTLTQAFGYDDLNRLSTWSAGAASQGFQYDLTGNRTQLTVGTTVHGYTVAATSNRLTATAGPAPAQTNAYDAAGNLSSNGTASFTYSDRGRMSRATVGANQINYLYNGLGQRVSKQGPTALVASGRIVFVHDEAGRLIGEYDAALRTRQETVYLGDTPVAVLTQTVAGTPAVTTTTVNYVYPDHLDTARVITRASDNRMRWRWDGADPFGVAAPNQNPANLGAFEFNPRFPGQYYDRETNLHFNYFRDYDPRVGRYVQSDPIGLAGGINTYAYVGGNPLRLVDPLGLANSGPYPRPTVPVGPAFIAATLSGPAFSFSLALSRSGRVFFGVGTGRVATSASCSIGLGVLRDSKNPTGQEVDEFLAGAGGGLDFGALGLGYGQQYSGGRTADILQFGIGLPGGNGGYSLPLW